MDPPVLLPINAEAVYYSRVYAGLVSVLILLSASLTAARIYTRLKSIHRLGVDDWFLVAAFVSSPIPGGSGVSRKSTDLISQALTVANWIVMLVATRPSITGAPFMSISTLLATAPLSVVSELLSTLALALIKTSIAALLLRLQQTSGWKKFLYGIIAVQIVTAIYLTVMHATRCIPLAGLWNPLITEKRCWSDQAFRVSLTITSVIVIVTDVIYALIPLSFLRGMKRPVRDRIVIGVLLSLGLVATAASIAKAVAVQSVGKGSNANPLSQGLAIALWAGVEEQLAVIAACIPCLKSLFKRVLLRFGLLTTQENTGNTGMRYGNNTIRHPRFSARRQTSTFGHPFSGHMATASVEEILGRDLELDPRTRGGLKKTEVSLEMSSERNASSGSD